MILLSQKEGLTAFICRQRCSTMHEWHGLDTILPWRKRRKNQSEEKKKTALKRKVTDEIKLLEKKKAKIACDSYLGNKKIHL